MQTLYQVSKRSNDIYKYTEYMDIKFVLNSHIFLKLTFNHSLFSFHIGAILNDFDFHSGGDHLGGFICNGLLHSNAFDVCSVCAFGVNILPFPYFPSLLIIGAWNATQVSASGCQDAVFRIRDTPRISYLISYPEITYQNE